MTYKAKKILLATMIGLAAVAGAVGTTDAAMMNNFGSIFDGNGISQNDLSPLMQMVQNRDNQQTQHGFNIQNSNQDVSEEVYIEQACQNAVASMDSVTGSYEEVRSSLGQSPEQYDEALNMAVQFMKQEGSVDQQTIQSLQELKDNLPQLLEDTDFLVGQIQTTEIDCSNPDIGQMMGLADQVFALMDEYMPEPSEEVMADASDFQNMTSDWQGPTEQQGTWSFFGSDVFGSLFGR